MWNLLPYTRRSLASHIFGYDVLIKFELWMVFQTLLSGAVLVNNEIFWDKY